MQPEKTGLKTDLPAQNTPLQKSLSLKDGALNKVLPGLTDLVGKAVDNLDTGSTDVPELKVIEHTPEEEAEAALALLLLELTEKDTEGDDYEKEAEAFRKILAEWEQEPSDGIILDNLDAEENDDPMISNFSRESADSKLTKTTSQYVGPGDEAHLTKGIYYSTVCTPMATEKSKFKHNPDLDFDLREQTIEGQIACKELWRQVWVGDYNFYVNERCDILSPDQLELRQKTCEATDKITDEAVHKANIKKVTADTLTFNPSTKLYYGSNCAAYTLEEVTGAFKKKENGKFEALKADKKSPKTYTLNKKAQTLVPLSIGDVVVPRMWVKADTCDLVTFAEASVLGCADCAKAARNLLLK